MPKNTEFPMENRKKLPKYLSEEDTRTLLQTPYHTKIRDRALLAIAAKCGLRASEILNLRKDDLEYIPSKNKYRLMVRGGKGGKDRPVPCDHDVAKLLETVMKESYREQGDKIFDMSYQALYKMFIGYGKKAGIEKKVTPHVLRHTYSVHRIRAGMDIVTLQKILGHNNIRTTTIYLQLTQEDVMDAADRYKLPY